MTQLSHDESLQADVMTALRRDETLPAAHIGVIATDGAVTLTGEVATEDQRLAASTLVQNVAGVRAVADELVVRPPGSPMRTEIAVAVDVARAIGPRPLKVPTFPSRWPTTSCSSMTGSLDTVI